MNTSHRFFLSRPTLAVAAAVFGSVAATASLHAQVTTYTSQPAFLNNLSSGAYFEGFSSFSGQALPSPQGFMGGVFSFSLSDGANNTIFYTTGSDAQGSVFATSNRVGDVFTINFTSGNVTAFGGNFFLSNGLENPDAGGNVTALLSTGQSITQASSSNYNTEPFYGFTSTAPVTSLTITGPGVADFVSIDNLFIGRNTAVPEPATYVMIVGGLCALLGVQRVRHSKAAL